MDESTNKHVASGVLYGDAIANTFMVAAMDAADRRRWESKGPHYDLYDTSNDHLL